MLLSRPMLNFQEMILRLSRFWMEQGCLVQQGYDLEVGAGTFNPATFLRCLGPEPYASVYVEPTRRPRDGRYGDNPNRLQFYHQMQVIIKPSPADVQALYLRSLEAVGLDLNAHDIRFVHDDWENPTIGAWGLGWEIWCDGMEITQFTYFQAIGGLPVCPVSSEITYGLERLAMYLQGVDSFFDLKWNDTLLYGDLYKRSEYEWSHYNFHEADTTLWLHHFEDFEKEAKALIKKQLPIPAYDFVIKASHAFNILDARGVLSVTERTGYITRIRTLATLLAECYIESREKMCFPLLKSLRYTETAPSPTPFSMPANPTEKQDFLLEIGSEELPATFVPLGRRALEAQMRSLLEEHGLGFSALETFATPRRLAVRVLGLSGGVASQALEKRGPPLSKAFTEKGEPTELGRGFFQSLQMTPPALQELRKGSFSFGTTRIAIRSVKGVDYLMVLSEQPALSTRTLLAEELPQLIARLHFPKKMRWGHLDVEYARPIRWLVALYGEEIVPFTFGDIVSSNRSWGHRQLAFKEIPIDHPRDYLEALRKHWVMADVEERQSSLLMQLNGIEETLNATATSRERVLAQVLHLVEWPFLTQAHFESRYLEAPKEVLISEMVEHQKYFPLLDAKGTLLPSFVIVCDREPTDLIRKGNLKALSPRLADGMFLYKADVKQPLEKLIEKLRHVIFQKELGSVWDKVERLKAYVPLLHAALPLTTLSTICRAAALSKADLASELVKEFPELQGVVGRLYALEQGEDPEVALALEEQWMPRGERAPLATTGAGILLSLAEKIDNFLTCFSLDLKPSSSSDPYGLRRQALGLLKMLIQGGHCLKLSSLFEDAFICFVETLPQTLKERIVPQKETLLAEIQLFIVGRFRILLSEFGFEKDLIESVLSQQGHQGLLDPFDLYSKVAALQKLRHHQPDCFSALLELHQRSKKILFSQNPHLISGWRAHQLNAHPAPGTRYGLVNPLLFQSQREESLFEQISGLKHALPLLLTEPHSSPEVRWRDAFLQLAQLQPALHTLFDEVKILSEDPALTSNRLSLLQEVWDLCEGLLDFSKLQEEIGAIK